MAQVAFIPLPDYQEHSPEEMNHRAAEFYDDLRRRRTVREFSDQPVPVEVIKDCLRAAGTAPNGANMQPWHFVVVSDAAIKQKIRVEAEKEEYEFYHHKAPQAWLDALAPLGDERAQAVPRDCAIFDSDLCPELRRAPRWAKGQALLRAGVSRYRHRHSDHRHTPCRSGVAHSHS
jgi:nitroreductase